MRHVVRAHPTVQVFFAGTFDVGPARDPDIIAGLEDINAIEEGDQAQTFEWNGEVVVDEVKNVGRN